MHVRLRPITAVLAATLTVVSFAACGGDSGSSDASKSDSGTSETKGADGATVDMKLIAFKPDSLTVGAGTEVTWRQSDAGVHTVTSGTVRQDGGGVTPEPDGSFDSGQIATNDTFQHTFAEAGTFDYFCAVHPATMRGQITVT